MLDIEQFVSCPDRNGYAPEQVKRNCVEAILASIVHGDHRALRDCRWAGKTAWEYLISSGVPPEMIGLAN